MTTVRMTGEQRRLQLLETAFAIIRTDGTAALNFVRLADAAGVSRPVVYEHFATKEGLFLALYQWFDDQLVRSIADAVRHHGDTLKSAATAISTAYVEAVVDAGPECGAVTAALFGHPGTRNFRQTSRAVHLDGLRTTLAPLISPTTDTAVLLGLLSALEGLAEDAATGRIGSKAAIAAAADIMVGALGSRPDDT